jgi:hypothetical protein
VRGYPTNGVPSQTAASFSVEYRSAPISVPLGQIEGQFRPHIFTDFGFADATDSAGVEHMASIGFGGDFTLGENLVAKIDVSQTLTAAGSTGAHEGAVAFQLTARF